MRSIYCSNRSPRSASKANSVGMCMIGTGIWQGAIRIAPLNETTIPAVRIGTCVLYPVSGLQAWLDRQAQGAPEGGRQ